MVEHDETNNDKAANDDAAANSEKMSTDMAGSGMTPDDAKNTTATGSSIPSGHGGAVSDDDIDAIDADHDKDRPTGQDHSLENYEDSEPHNGVGAIQSGSLIKENVADIADDEE